MVEFSFQLFVTLCFCQRNIRPLPRAETVP